MPHTDYSLLYECCICSDNLKNTHICQSCARPFCLECIQNWFATGANTCPHCRRSLNAGRLIKVNTLDQMQDTVKELVSLLNSNNFKDARNLCRVHEMQQLSLFCMLCEECVCVTCWYSQNHSEHKDSVVPVEEALRRYKSDWEQDFAWIRKQKKEVNRFLNRVQWNRDLLELNVAKVISCLNQTAQSELQELENEKHPLEQFQSQNVRIHDEWLSLTEGKDATNLAQRVKLMKTIKTLRLEHVPVPTYVNFKSDLLPEPNVLTFRLERFGKIMQKSNYYETNPQTIRGFVWHVRVTKTQSSFLCLLRLLEGKPGIYWVALANDQEQEYFWALNKYVYIGTFEPVNDKATDTAEVIVRLRLAKTYPEMCLQLQDYVKQLETETSNAEKWRSIFHPVVGAIKFCLFGVITLGFIITALYYTHIVKPEVTVCVPPVEESYYIVKFLGTIPKMVKSILCPEVDQKCWWSL